MANASNHFKYKPIPIPPSADPAKFKDFGRQVEGFEPDNVTSEQMEEIMDMLYRVRATKFVDLHRNQMLISTLYSTPFSYSRTSSSLPSSNSR